MPLKPGDRIDRYTLVAPLGAGAQGAVWKVIAADQPGLFSRAAALIFMFAPRQRPLTVS